MTTALQGLRSDRRAAPRYRVRSLCVADGPDGPFSGRLEDISGTGVFIATNARPALGASVVLRHPVAGEIDATVSRHGDDGVALAFVIGRDAVTFALRVIGADMTERSLAHASG